MTTALWILGGLVLWALVALGVAFLLGRVVRMRDRQVPDPPDRPGAPPAPPPGPPRQRGPAERPRGEDG